MTLPRQPRCELLHARLRNLDGDVELVSCRNGLTSVTELQAGLFGEVFKASFLSHFVPISSASTKAELLKAQQAFLAGIGVSHCYDILHLSDQAPCTTWCSRLMQEAEHLAAEADA